jgi:hypothetical protein
LKTPVGIVHLLRHCRTDSAELGFSGRSFSLDLPPFLFFSLTFVLGQSTNLAQWLSRVRRHPQSWLTHPNPPRLGGV